MVNGLFGRVVLATAVLFSAQITEAEETSIHFAGYDWLISHAPQGKSPGPNVFLNDPAIVRLDGRGRLRLAIDQVRGIWASAEVRLTEPLGYGTYELVVTGYPGGIDPSAVFGFFTFDHGAPPHYREIDVEIARWGDPEHPGGNFSVQPYDTPGNQRLFSAQDLGRTVVFQMKWTGEGVRFLAANRTESSDTTVAEWERPGLIEPGEATVHINLWLFRGHPLAVERKETVTIESFSFFPAEP